MDKKKVHADSQETKFFGLQTHKRMHVVARFMVCRSRCKLFTSSNLLGSFGRSCANHVEALDLFRHGPLRLVRYVRCWLLRGLRVLDGRSSDSAYNSAPHAT